RPDGGDGATSSTADSSHGTARCTARGDATVSLAAPQKTRASLKGPPEGGPVVPLCKARTNGRPNDNRDCRVCEPCALAGADTCFASPLKARLRRRGQERPCHLDR